MFFFVCFFREIYNYKDYILISLEKLNGMSTLNPTVFLCKKTDFVLLMHK